MDNQEQGRDGQPLADHVLLTPDVDPFPPQRTSLVNGLNNLTSTVDGLSNRLDMLTHAFQDFDVLQIWSSNIYHHSLA